MSAAASRLAVMVARPWSRPAPPAPFVAVVAAFSLGVAAALDYLSLATIFELGRRSNASPTRIDSRFKEQGLGSLEQTRYDWSAFLKMAGRFDI